MALQKVMERPEENASPNSDSLFFDVKLTRKKANERLGIETVLIKAPTGFGLVVQKVLPEGAVEAWNRKSYEPVRVRPGDFVINVNDIQGDEAALSYALKTKNIKSLRIQRAFQEPLYSGPTPTPLAGPKAVVNLTEMFNFQVSLQKEEDEQLGIEIQRELRKPTQPGLIIKRVTGGIVGKHNQACKLPYDIRAGDCIVRVNSVCNDMEGMIFELRSCSTLRLLLIRWPSTEVGGDGLSSTSASPTKTREPIFSVNEHKAGGDGLCSSSSCPAGMEEEQFPAQECAEENMSGPASGDKMDTGALPSDCHSDLGENSPRGSNTENASNSNVRKNINVRDIIAGMGPRGTAAAAQPVLLNSVEKLMGTIENTFYQSGKEQPSEEEMVQDRAKFDVVLGPRGGAHLGIDVIFVVCGGQCASIFTSISPGGSIYKWNKRSEMPYKVMPGDYIVGVNDLKPWHDPATLVQTMSDSSQPLHLRVQRGVGAETFERRVTGRILQRAPRAEGVENEQKASSSHTASSDESQKGSEMAQAPQAEKEPGPLHVAGDLELTPEMVQDLAASLTESPERPGSSPHDPASATANTLETLGSVQEPSPDSREGDAASGSRSGDSPSGSKSRPRLLNKAIASAVRQQPATKAPPPPPVASDVSQPKHALTGSHSDSSSLEISVPKKTPGPIGAWKDKSMPDPAEIAALLTGRPATIADDSTSASSSAWPTASSKERQDLNSQEEELAESCCGHTFQSGAMFCVKCGSKRLAKAKSSAVQDLISSRPVGMRPPSRTASRTESRTVPAGDWRPSLASVSPSRTRAEASSGATVPDVYVQKPLSWNSMTLQ